MRQLFSKFALAASGFAASMWAFAAPLQDEFERLRVKEGASGARE